MTDVTDKSGSVTDASDLPDGWTLDEIERLEKKHAGMTPTTTEEDHR